MKQGDADICYMQSEAAVKNTFTSHKHMDLRGTSETRASLPFMCAAAGLQQQ